ncbi:pentatricopeptide repeat-containing protein At1g31430 [Ipomoea triloba]|uniref:pentatricopeptide repeat-containing protein At1g31430 n=1 Tax=Ipomoea triloba TaxID=35885 RepID=UPI00125E815F|nr:pentatricopeptide repeat-containing protein At1g31430 [Ipomoea triloba]
MDPTVMSTPGNCFTLQLLSRRFAAKLRRFYSGGAPHAPPISKKTCIHLLKACKSMAKLKQIQALLFTLGIHQHVDTLHKLMAFTADPLLGNLSHAQLIFDRIENPTLFIYNVMIKAHTKTGRFRNALFLFDELRGRGLWPDHFTYPFVFKAVGGLRVVLEGEKIHGFVLKSGVGSDCYVCNSVMDMYGELGYAESMKKVFDELPNRDSVSWNVLISGYVRCSRFQEAIRVYRMMGQEGSIKPEEATVVSTLSACTALKKLELGKEIHQYVSKELGYTIRIENALVDMYCKCGCLSEAGQIFNAMSTRNVMSWTSMVSGYVSCGQLDEARDLFERSPVKDLVLWTAMINGYVQFNLFEYAMTLFQAMQMQRIKPDKYTLVSLLKGCAQVGALDQGEWIRNYIIQNGIVIDAVVGTALMEMYSKCGCLEKSLEIFYELREKDAASWTSIICALAMNGDTGKALELFSQMLQAGIRPDDITFIGVLTACSHGGLVEEGRGYFDSMTRIYGIEPSLEHYGCLIDLLGRAGLLNEAEHMISTIPNKDNKIVVTLYGALLSACRIHGDVDMGERIVKMLMEIESSDSSTHTLLANMYASANRWEDVSKVRKNMKALHVKKLPGSSSIEVEDHS